MTSITQLDGNTRRLISSGQVITDLAAIVKELLENSLDASAKSIDVRLVDHGATHIECTDDGSGVAPRDFATVAARHATSKLCHFSDLRQAETRVLLLRRRFLDAR